MLRALRKDPATVAALFAEFAAVEGADAHLDRATAVLRDELAEARAAESDARRLAERLALSLQAALLVRHAPAAVADAFCASRLGGDWGHAFGTLSPRADTEAIVRRAWPLL